MGIKRIQTTMIVTLELTVDQLKYVRAMIATVKSSHACIEDARMLALHQLDSQLFPGAAVVTVDGMCFVSGLPLAECRKLYPKFHEG